MATPLDLLRSQDPNLYLVNDQALTDQLWEQYKDKYPDKEIFTQFLTTEEGLFDKTKLQPIQTTLESEDQKLLQEGDRKPPSEFYKDKAYYDNLLAGFKRSFFDTTALGFKGASGVRAFFDLPEEDQKVLIKNEWVRDKLSKAGLVDDKGRLNLSWLPSEDNQTRYIRTQSEKILADPDQFSPDRVAWAKDAQEFLVGKKIPIEERTAYRIGEGIEEWAEDRYQVDDEYWSENKMANYIHQVVEGLGSTAPFIVAGVATLPLGGLPSFGVGLTAAASIGAGEAVEEAIDYKEIAREIGQEFDDDDVAMAAILGTVPGAIDYLPVAFLLNRFGKIVPGAKSAIIASIRRRIATGAFEGTTESVQRVLHNVIAQNYDANKGVWEDARKEFGPAFGVGFILGFGGKVDKATKEERETAKKDKIDEREVKADGPSEAEVEETDTVGEADSLKPDYSPKGTPVVGTSGVTIFNKDGTEIGRGKPINYYDNINDDNKVWVEFEHEDGTISKHPIKDIEFKVPEEDTTKEKPKVTLPEGAPLTEEQQAQYDAAPDGSYVEIVNEEGYIVQTIWKPVKIKTAVDKRTLSELRNEWAALEAGEIFEYEDEKYTKYSDDDIFPENLA